MFEASEDGGRVVVVDAGEVAELAREGREDAWIEGYAEEGERLAGERDERW